MAIAAARVGTQLSAVKCRICGRPSLRGAKLCDQCVAAVKRARHINTIASQFLPQSGSNAPAYPPLGAPRSSLRRGSAWWSWLPTKPGEWGVLIAFTLFGAAIAGTAYLAIQETAERELKGQITPAAVDPAATRANVAPAAPEASAHATGAPAAESAATERVAQPESVETQPAEVVVEPPQTMPLEDARAPRKTATENRSAKRPLTRASPVASAAPRDGESKTTSAAPEPAAVVAPQAAAAPTPDRRAPDRWETMNAALAACTRETFLAGVMCTERVRYQYCEGFWGQVAQCRAATPGSGR